MSWIEVKRSDAPRKPQDFSRIPKVLATIALFFAVLMLVIAGMMAIRPYTRMTHGMLVQAKVQRSEVYSKLVRDAKGRQTLVYGARFTFAFPFNGAERSAIADLGYSSSFRWWIERQVKKLPVGSTRLISINPNDWNDVSLASGYDSLSFAASYALLMSALVMLLIGTIGWAWYRSLAEREALRLGKSAGAN